jgi:hypothetical protein
MVIRNPPTNTFDRYICIVTQAGRNENRKMTDKGKMDRHDGTRGKSVPSRIIGIHQNRDFRAEIRIENGFYMIKNKKLKNSIDGTHLCLLSYGLHKKIQMYLSLREEVDFMGKTRQMFLSVAEIQGLLGMSRSYCYELVAKLNDELEKMDKIVIPGKVPTQFFLEKFYGMELTDEMLEEARKHETKKRTV